MLFKTLSLAARKFLLVDLSKKLLILEVVGYMIYSYFLVKFHPFNNWSGRLGEKRAAQAVVDAASLQTAGYIRAVILTMNTLSRNRFTCLMQAVAGKLALNRRHIPNTLVLGVKLDKKEGAQTALKAHAWLDVGDQTILGGEVNKEYSVVGTFHSSGRISAADAGVV